MGCIARIVAMRASLISISPEDKFIRKLGSFSGVEGGFRFSCTCEVFALVGR